MQSLLLFTPDLAPFDPTAVERAFRSNDGFTNIRFDDPGGALIESEYIAPGGHTFVRLSRDASTVAMSNTRDAALRAALLIQKSLGIPLRMVDDDNSFDLTFSDISTIEDLEAAMEDARTS